MLSSDKRKNFSGMQAVAVSAYGRCAQDEGHGYINTGTSMGGLGASCLGTCRQSSLDAAREEARQRAASVAQGANPSVERRAKRTAGTVLELVEAYLGHAKGRQRPRSYKETERHLRIHAAPLHHDRAEAVHRRDIAALLERVAKNSGPVAANRLRATLSALWSWALRTGLINSDNNPVAFTIRQPEKARERVLSDAELKAIWERYGR